MVYSPPSLEAVPADVRPLIERCLDKDPGRRPTARDLLAATGAVQPAAGWLPGPVTRTFVQYPALAVDAVSGPVLAADGPVPAGPGVSRTVTVAKMAPAWGQVPAASPRRPRRIGRPLAVASLVAGLVAASAAGGFALTAYAHPAPAAPAGQAAPAQTAGSPVTSAPSSAPYPGSSPRTDSGSGSGY